MIRSTPSSRARRAASAPRMPQSTETISAHAFGVQPLDRRRLQAVAVPQALRDEVHDVAAEHFERAAQDHGRRDAVDVVVAVDGDAFTRARWRARAARRLHACRRAGRDRGDDRATGARNRAASLGLGQAAHAQQPRDDGLERQARAATTAAVARHRYTAAWCHRRRDFGSADAHVGVCSLRRGARASALGVLERLTQPAHAS